MGILRGQRNRPGSWGRDRAGARQGGGGGAAAAAFPAAGRGRSGRAAVPGLLHRLGAPQDHGDAGLEHHEVAAGDQR